MTFRVPPELAEQVRVAAGPRGLNAFVVEALYAHLGKKQVPVTAPATKKIPEILEEDPFRASSAQPPLEASVQREPNHVAYHNLKRK